METALCILSRKNVQENDNQSKRIGLLMENDYYTQKLMERQFKQQPIVYPTVKNAIEALNNNLVDEVFLFTYTAQKALAEDERNALKVTILPVSPVSFALAVDKHQSYLLNNVLNKGVQSMFQGYIDNIIIEEITSLRESNTVLSFIYDQPLVAVAIVAALVILAAGIKSQRSVIRGQRVNIRRRRKIDDRALACG